MVFLKKTIIITLLLRGFSVSAQETKALQNAFIESFALETQGKFEAAAGVLRSTYDAEHYEMNLRLGWLYYKAKLYEESNRYYNTAIEIMPYSIEAKLGATLPKAKLVKWDEVVQLYKDVLIIDSKNSTALYNLGLIYYNRGIFHAANENFEELSNLYPTDYNAILMYAWSNVKLGKIREAKVLFNKVLLLYPDDTSAKEGLEVAK